MKSDKSPALHSADDIDEIPVFIIRTPQREVVAVRQSEEDDFWVGLALDLVGTLMELFPGHQPDGKWSARMFSLDDASLAKWDRLARRGKDGYSYGVMWGEDGKIASHLKLKEMTNFSASSATLPFNPLAAAQIVLLVSLKSDIARLEVALDGITADVKNIVRFLEVEQESNVLAALETINGIHTSMRRSGRVAQEDWDRVASLEQILKAVERQVLSEMSEIADAMTFDTIPQAKKAMKSVTAERLEQLKFLLFYNLLAQEQWIELMITRKRETGSLQDFDIEQAGSGVIKTRERALNLLRKVEHSSHPDAALKGTRPFKMLYTKGLLVGWQYERIVIRNARDLRRVMLQVATDRQAIEFPSEESLHLAGQGEQEA